VPTDNLEVCDFCLDYEPPTQRLDVERPCMLTAQGDAARVEVFRSPLVKAGSRMFAPVREHIETHGLKLVYTETDVDPDWMHGERIREIYA
jgi:hypothetical protein